MRRWRRRSPSGCIVSIYRSLVLSRRRHFTRMLLGLSRGHRRHHLTRLLLSLSRGNRRHHLTCLLLGLSLG